MIGELLVLERHLLPHLTAQDAIASWHGPLLAPKDFEIGRVCIEAKARRPGASPSVVISSEHQLDGTDLKGLILAVAALDRAATESSGRFTVTDVAARVRDKLQESNPSALAEYESRLTAAGFRWVDDYSDSSWIEGPATLYRVTGQFPRIGARDIAPGVQHVKYVISLVECQPYLIPESELLALLKGP